MLLTDVNKLIYAHRGDATTHARYKAWVDEMLAGEAAFGVSELVLSGFVRVVTHPRVFKQPTTLDIALDFADGLRSHETAVAVAPGERHPYRSFQRHASMMPTGAHHTAIATTVRWT